MNKQVFFTVDGEPKPQPRPRAFARKMGNKFVARVFDAGTAEAWKSQVVLASKAFRPEQPMDGPVLVRLSFYLQRPKAHYIAGNPARGLRPDAPFYHTGRPDFDNLAKAVCDALTQCGGFWHDDSQIATAIVTKMYHDQPGCGINISLISSQDNVSKVQDNQS